jgi:LacI family transcriptional regulator
VFRYRRAETTDEGDTVTVTIHDVAREAGVSASTVSRAMTGGTVSSATRATVMDAAARLGYRPNRAARGLTTGRTGALGLLVPDLGNPYFAEVIKGVAARTRTRDQPLLVSDTDEDSGLERDTIASLRRSTDGLVLCSPRADDAALAEIARGGPTVLINRRVDGIPSVTSNMTDGVEQALRHLSALGHTRVAYLCGPADSWAERSRSEGMALGASIGVEVVRIPAIAPTFDGGVYAADLALTTGATAIIAFNDLIALGVLNRLTSRGISVPAEMSLIGHDDIEMATMSHPGLTTVSVSTVKLGTTAAELLLRLLAADRADAGHEPAATVVLPSALVVRRTTDLAPTAQHGRS